MNLAAAFNISETPNFHNRGGSHYFVYKESRDRNYFVISFAVSYFFLSYTELLLNCCKSPV